MRFRYLSVCSGIEAASVAWKPLGWECAGVSEIDKFPRAVLQHRLGAVPVEDDHRWQQGQNFTPLFGDFTKIEAHHVGPVDLLVGGTPCQSFSIAGKRLGLDDPRGNLTLEFFALAQRVRPSWIVWENVPGVLSHDDGRTFGTVLGLMGECGFRWAYRVLDAQYVRVGRFGRAVPQRRRRVFLVGYSGTADINPAAVLFDRESLRGNPAPRREAGQGPAPTLAARTRGGGGLGTDFDCDGGLIAGQHGPAISPAMKARDSKGPSSDGDGDGDGLPLISVAHALRGEGFDASEDGTGRGTPIVPVQHAIAIQEREPFTIMERGRDGQSNLESRQDGTANAILTPNGGRGGLGVGAIAAAWGVRRLTPRECERLMGFPDDFTLIPWRGKDAEDCPDGPRYKALGNSMAVNVICFIGERIEAVRTAPAP